MTLFNDVIETNDADLTYEQLLAKYTDNEGIAKAMSHKEKFINQLKTEQSGIRADLETRIKYEEFLDRMNSLQSGTTKGAPSPDDTTSNNNTQTPPSVTPQDIERLLEQRDAKKRQESNLEYVERKLTETLGPNFGSKIKQQAANLDMSEETLTAIAAQNPKAFLKLVGAEEKTEQSFTPPPRSMFNADSFKPSLSNTKNFSYYENLRKTKPTEYWKPAIQNEMMKALEEKGDAFMDT